MMKNSSFSPHELKKRNSLFNTTSSAANSNSVYIEATQNGIVRYDANHLTTSPISGLFTQDLRVCLCIIFYGKGKISLIHTDGNIHPQSIKDEYGWVGQDCQIYLYQGKGDTINYSALIEKSGIFRNIKCEATPREFVAIDIQGRLDIINKPQHISEPPERAYRHALNQIRYMLIPYINKVNKGLTAQATPPIEQVNIPADLQFDGQSWTALPSVPNELKPFFDEFKNRENIEHLATIINNYDYLKTLVNDLSRDYCNGDQAKAKTVIVNALSRYITDYFKNQPSQQSNNRRQLP